VFLIPPCPETGTWSIDDKVMQKIAAEMRLSETAFLTPGDEARSFAHSTRFRLRWFTPTVATVVPPSVCRGVDAHARARNTRAHARMRGVTSPSNAERS
jgi:hypothetical protein